MTNFVLTFLAELALRCPLCSTMQFVARTLAKPMDLSVTRVSFMPCQLWQHPISLPLHPNHDFFKEAVLWYRASNQGAERTRQRQGCFNRSDSHGSDFYVELMTLCPSQ